MRVKKGVKGCWGGGWEVVGGCWEGGGEVGRRGVLGEVVGGFGAWGDAMVLYVVPPNVGYISWGVWWVEVGFGKSLGRCLSCSGFVMLHQNHVRRARETMGSK